jgi:hypothetical protein
LLSFLTGACQWLIPVYESVPAKSFALKDRQGHVRTHALFWVIRSVSFSGPLNIMKWAVKAFRLFIGRVRPGGLMIGFDRIYTHGILRLNWRLGVALLLGVGLYGCSGVVSGPVPNNSASGTIPPIITTQVTNQVVIAGQTATFTVAATGTAPLSYQWRKSGVSIAGATASSYTTPATTAADNGATFSVVVSNTAGTATSAAAILTVTTSGPVKTISVSPTTLSFGNVDTGSSSSQNVTITNTGNVTVTIAQIVAAGSGFTTTGSAMSLPAAQKATVAARFAPVGTGPVSGTLSITSDANGSPAVVNLSGTGVTPGPPNPNAWYVRPDGGTATQCTGKTDAAYPGSGSNQPCAFINPHYLWGNDVAGETAQWKIAGGDTVIIRNGSYRIGYKGPNSSDAWGQCPGDPYGCGMPPVPSGTAIQHTRILGENFANCTSMPEIHGGYGLYQVIQLQGSSNVDVGCLEITDHSSCTRVGANNCNTTFPLDDYATYGVVTDVNTKNVNLSDLYIHGLANTGIWGPNGGGITVTRVRIAGNAGSGWNFDDGNGTQTTGTTTMSYVTVEWNGCTDVYPPTNPPSYTSCYDDNSGGYGDGVGTPNTGGIFLVDHSTFRYNTQDGLDLLHVNGSGAVISVTDSIAYGNMGNQMKEGSTTATFQNNLVIGNCLRLQSAFPPNPTGFNSHLSDFCRANGDAVVIGTNDTAHAVIQNNSVTSNYSIAFNIQCIAIGGGTGSCTAASHVNFDNNLIYGFGDLSGSHTFITGIYEQTNSSDFMSNPGGSRRNNLLFHTNNNCGAAPAVNEICFDPLLVSESDINSIDFHLTVGSPARNAGISIPSILTDYDGKPRPSSNLPYDIGAFQF